MSDAKVRIFVSSPSDVDHERALLKDVCGRLREEYLSYFEVQAILWEEEALTADRNFQDGILRPADCEIVVVVLWTRLGTPLPDEPYGGMTGTQWEFVNAVEASAGHGHPEVLVYKKTTPRFVDITNAEATREALEDRRRLEEFFRANFFNPDESFRRAFRTFDSDAGFRDLVEGQLRKLLNRRISAEKRASAGAAEWRGSPYRPDGPYAQADARIFTGREAETRDLLARLAGRSFLLLSGASGSGKTSLIHAGLLSRLERPFLLEGVAGCRIALVDPSPGAGPATDSPTGPLAALAAGLCGPQALGPTLASFGVTAEGLTQLLAHDPGAAAAQVGAALTVLARDRKGQTGMAEGEVRLALVLDPLDGLLAACAEQGPTACAGLVAAAAALASGGRTWVIGVVGTARLGLLAPLLPLLAVSDRDGVPGLDPDAWYHLEAPAPGRVRQVVEIPARAAGVEVEGQAPGGRRSLVDLLEAEAGALRHWPPLVEAALDLAYRRAAERAQTLGAAGATLARADYEGLGGLAGVVLARAEAVWAGLDAGVRSALPVLCRALISLDGARAGLRSGDLRVLEADPACRALVAALVEARLVAVDAERDHLASSPCPQADYSLSAELRETLRQTWAGWRARLRPKRAAAALTAELAPELAADPTAAVTAPATSQGGPDAEAGPAGADDLTDWAAWRAGATFTHPVLLTGWSPVRDWLARSDNRQTLQLRHQIGRRAQLWRRTDCNREYLLGAAGYPAAKALAATLAGEIEPLEADYLAQSALYLGLQRRRSQALRAIGASLLVLLALATWAALWALDASHSARILLHRSELASAATDIATGNSPRALMRALAAAPDLPQEASATVSRLMMENRLIASAQGAQDDVPGPEGGPISPAFRDDGERLITATPAAGVSLWRLAGGRFELEGPLADPGPDLRRLAFVGRGEASRILAGGPDGVWLLPAGPGEAPDFPCPMDFGSVVALDPTGRHVAVAQAVGQTQAEGAAAGPPTGYGVCIMDLNRPGAALRIPDPEVPDASPLHRREILGLDFSPDGQRLVTASADGSAKVIDLAKGEPALTLPPEGNLRLGINRAVFDPVDGRRIGLACADERVRVYGTDGTLIANLGEIHEGGVTIRLHASGVRDLDFVRDGRYLVAGDENGQVVRWDLSHQGGGQLLGQHRMAITHLRVAPPHGDADAEPVALTSSDDSSARLWGVYTGREFAAFSHDAAVSDAWLSTDGSRVMTIADRDGSARLWGVRRITCIGHRLAQADRVGTVAVSPDAVMSAGATNDSAPEGEGTAGRRPLVFAVGSHDGSIGVWRQDGADQAAPPQRLQLLTGHAGRVRRVEFSPSGRWLASASYDGMARAWDPRTGAGCTMDAVVATPETGSGNTEAVPEVYRALFGPEEDWVLTVSNDPNPVRLWHWDGRTCAPHDPDPAFAQGPARVQAAAVGRDAQGAQVVATGDDAGRVRVMRRREGRGWERLCDLDAHKGAVRDVALSPDGGHLASAGKDGKIRLVQVLAQGCALQPPLTGHRSQVNALSFAPDGTSLASAGQDGHARVWRLDGTPLAKLIGHRERVSLVEFSPDGRWILTGSRDGDLRLWRAPTGPVGTLDGSWLTLGAGLRTVASAAFTPDGKGLVAGYWGNAAYLWRLWSDEPPDPDLVATWGAERARLSLMQEADRFRRENRLDLGEEGP